MSGSIALHSKGKLTGMKARILLTMYLKADCLVCRANRQSYLRAHPGQCRPSSHSLGFQVLAPFALPWVACSLPWQGKDEREGISRWSCRVSTRFFFYFCFIVCTRELPRLTWVTSWMEEVPLVRGDLKEGPRKFGNLAHHRGQREVLPGRHPRLL